MILPRILSVSVSVFQEVSASQPHVCPGRFSYSHNSAIQIQCLSMILVCNKDTKEIVLSLAMEEPIRSQG